MRVFHSVVLREKPPSKRPRIRSSIKFHFQIFFPSFEFVGILLEGLVAGFALVILH